MHRFNTIINDAWKAAIKDNQTIANFDSDITTLIEYINRTNAQDKLPIKLQSGSKTRPWRMLSDRMGIVSRSYMALHSHLSGTGQKIRINRIDKALLDQIVEIFDQLTEVFDELEQVTEPTVNKCIPLICSLKMNLSRFNVTESDSIQQCAVNMLVQNILNQMD